MLLCKMYFSPRGCLALPPRCRRGFRSNGGDCKLSQTWLPSLWRQAPPLLDSMSLSVPSLPASARTRPLDISLRFARAKQKLVPMPLTGRSTQTIGNRCPRWTRVTVSPGGASRAYCCRPGLCLFVWRCIAAPTATSRAWVCAFLPHVPERRCKRSVGQPDHHVRRAIAKCSQYGP